MREDYYIDPYIVSILFQQIDTEEVLDTYYELLDKQGQVIDLSLKNFLLEKAVPETEIDKILAFEDDYELPQEIAQLINTDEFRIKIQNNINSLLKAYYDVLIPKLSEEKKIELNEYIADYKKMLIKQQNVINKGINFLTEVLDKAGVGSYGQLEKKSAYSEIVEGYLNTTSKISNDKKSKFDRMVLEYINSQEKPNE